MHPEYTQDILFKPESGWFTPATLLLVDPFQPIAIDLETYDPLLKTKGPSWRYAKGHVAGIAVAQGSKKTYIPVRHPDSQLIDCAVARLWIADVIKSHQSVIYMANASYDLGWLHHIGALPKHVSLWPLVRDVQIAAALLEEDHPQGYSLNALGKRFLKESKDEAGLRQAAAAYELDPKKDMWQLPARYVGPYAEQDASLTLRLGTWLDRVLEREGLTQIRDLEYSVTPILHKMEVQGVRFDMARAERLNSTLLKRQRAMEKNLGIDVWSSEKVAQALIAEGYQIPRTAKGNYSCDKKVLKSLEGPMPQAIRQLRELSRLRETFVEAAAEYVHNGRVFPQYVQMGRDAEGTVTGRLSCKNPNIQQVPKRSEIGKEIRKLYLADEGLLWAKADYSSQEPRLQIHFALKAGLKSAEAARDAFHAGKKLYTFMEETMDGMITYDEAKGLVLGRSYRMGIKTMAGLLNKPEDYCQTILDLFDDNFPYISELADMVEQTARTRGYIKTLCGRRRRFNYWEPDHRSDAIPVYGEEAAKLKFKGKIRRAHIRKAFNSLIQGSAADQTKIAMVKIYEATETIPYLQAHDELGLPIRPEYLEEDAKSFAWLMEQAVPDLDIQFKVDCDIAAHWQ